jgi:hypothetical protein
LCFKVIVVKLFVKAYLRVMLRGTLDVLIERSLKNGVLALVVHGAVLQLRLRPLFHNPGLASPVIESCGIVPIGVILKRVRAGIGKVLQRAIGDSV